MCGWTKLDTNNRAWISFRFSQREWFCWLTWRDKKLNPKCCFYVLLLYLHTNMHVASQTGMKAWCMTCCVAVMTTKVIWHITVVIPLIHDASNCPTTIVCGMQQNFEYFITCNDFFVWNVLRRFFSWTRFALMLRCVKRELKTLHHTNVHEL